MPEGDRREPPWARSTSEPVADIRLSRKGEQATVTQTFPVRWPNAETGDSRVLVSAADLRRWRKHLKELQSTPSLPAEVLLGIGTLAIGGSLSAIASHVSLGSSDGILFYVALPIVATAAIVSYVVIRSQQSRSRRRLLSDVLEESDAIFGEESKEEDRES